MNVNIRETGSHVEFEPSSYYAAFSCELEASAYPMWSIISHLKDPSHAPLAKKIMLFCVNYLQDWLDAVNFYQHPKFNKVSDGDFHLNGKNSVCNDSLFLGGAVSSIVSLSAASLSGSVHLPGCKEDGNVVERYPPVGGAAAETDDASTASSGESKTFYVFEFDIIFIKIRFVLGAN